MSAQHTRRRQLPLLALQLALAQLHEANAAAYAALAPTIALWEGGEGDERQLKRFQRRKELQLLAWTPASMKERVPTFEWTAKT